MTAALLTEAQAAELLGREPATLRNWRSRGTGPAWVRNPDTGRFLGYHPDDFETWLNAGRHPADT